MWKLFNMTKIEIVSSITLIYDKSIKREKCMIIFEIWKRNMGKKGKLKHIQWWENARCALLFLIN